MCEDDHGALQPKPICASGMHVPATHAVAKMARSNIFNSTTGICTGKKAESD